MEKPSPVSESSAHLDLTDALPVLAESTTSRVLVTDDVMRIVQFTFDAGEMLTDHTSPRAVTVQVVSGQMQFTVDGTEHVMGGRYHPPRAGCFTRPGRRDSSPDDPGDGGSLGLICPPQ
jgi:hypothetical protein